MNRSRLIRITAAFFAVMLCFTILSRAADQAGIAAVQVQKPESRMILHTVTAAGKVVQNREVAIVTEPDERVVEIAVEKGQKVAKGDLLFTIDTELLQEKILNQRQEIEKQKLQLGDAGSQQDVRAAQKANDQASAAEQYSLSTKKAQVQVSRAKRDLDAAKQALTDYRKKNESGSTATDNTVEETLQNALEAAYLDAQKELTALQWRIENAVNTALNGTGAQLVKNGMCVTRAAEEEALILEEEQEGEFEDAGAVDSPEQDTKQTDGESTAQDIDIIIEPSDQEVNTGSEPSDSSVISSAIPGVSDTAQPSTPSHSDADDGVASPVPDRELTEQQVRDTYAQELDAATKKVETAKKAKEAAEQALMQYQQEQLTAADASGKEQERQLLAAVQTAGDAYEDAVLAANEAAVTAGRAVAAAGISDASDSTLAVGEITVEQMELQLEKLERLLEADGRICAPSVSPVKSNSACKASVKHTAAASSPKPFCRAAIASASASLARVAAANCRALHSCAASGSSCAVPNKSATASVRACKPTASRAHIGTIFLKYGSNVPRGTSARRLDGEEGERNFKRPYTNFTKSTGARL